MKKVLITLLIGAISISFVGCGNDSEIEGLNKTIKEQTQELTDKDIQLKDKEKKIYELDSQVTTLQAKLDEAKPWFEMKEEERKAEEERLAAEKAQKEADEKAKKEEEERIAAEKKLQEEQAAKEAEAHKYETGLTWEDIARDGHKGELGQFEGKVIQVMNADTEMQYRVAINGDYNQVMLVVIPTSKLHTTLLEDDYIYFKGTSAGTIDYTTVMGSTKTIPAFIADEYNL